MASASANLVPRGQVCVPVMELGQALRGIARDLELEFGTVLSREQIEQVLADAVFDQRTVSVTRWLPLLVYRRCRECLLRLVGSEGAGGRAGNPAAHARCVPFPLAS